MSKTNDAIRKRRKEKQLLARKAEEERLLTNYVEGSSNIDFENVNLEDFYLLIFSKDLTLEEKEKVIGKPILIISKEEYLAREMAKFDESQPKFPQGKYQDLEEVYINIYQKFFQALRDSSPHIFEDLRKLLPDFKILFGSHTEKYFEIVDVEYENIIPTVGRTMIANNLTAASPTNVMRLNKAAVGTGTNTPANANTTLQTETYRNDLASRTNASNIAYVTAFFNATETSGTFREAGIFSDGSSFFRWVKFKAR